MDTVEHLRKRLKAYKKKQKLYWVDIAAAAGLTSGWINKFVGKNSHSYGIDKLEKLQKYLDKVER